MNTGFTLADAEFLAELERDLAVSMAEVERHLADTEPEFEALTASLAAEPLLHIELDDLALADDLDLDFFW